LNWHAQGRDNLARTALLGLLIVLVATGVVAGSDLVADSDITASPSATSTELGVRPNAIEMPIAWESQPLPSLGSQTPKSYAPISIESSTSADAGTLSAKGQISPASPISLLGAFDSSDSTAVPALTRYIPGITDAEAAVNQGGGSIPPDPMIAVGLNHIVTVVNSSVEVHSKSGTQLASMALDTFFSTFTLAGGTFDPKVRYDQYRDRFVIVALDGNSGTAGNSQILVAVSDDDDPIGTWYQQSIPSVIDIGGTDHWADFPGLGMDADALYITNNMYPFGASGLFAGQRLWILAKDPFYSGGVVTSPTIMDPWVDAGFDEGDAVPSMPSHAFGSLPGSVGTFLLAYSGLSNGTTEYVAVMRIEDPLGTPRMASFQYVSLNNIEDFSVSFPDAPQFGSSATIATNDRRALDLVWRNNGLWAVFTIVPPTGSPDAAQATAHWIKINTSDLGGLALADQGNVGGNDVDSNAHTFFPSIAVDSAGNMAMSFALSSPNNLAGAYYTGRLAGDPAETTRNTGVLRAGSATYDSTIDFGQARWGDYSGIALDPANEAEFWAFGEFARDTNKWGTHIGRFSFADTPTAPQNVSATVNVALAEATVTWNAPTSDGGLPITEYLVLSTPGSHSATTSANATQATIPGLTRGITYTFTVTPSNNQGPGATSTASNSITAATVPGPPTTATAIAGVNSANVSWTAPADNGGSAVIDYLVTSAPGGLTASTTATTAAISGLSPGASYTFTVTARNIVGSSSSSAPSASITTPTVPDAPIGVTAVAKVESADVSWAAPGSGGSPITLYTVASAPGGIIATTTATSTTVMGLTNATSYTFSVVAVNAVGTSTVSTSSNAVVPGSGLVFNPALLVLVNVGDSATTTIMAQAVSTSTSRVIVNLQIPPELTISAISCGGIFAGAASSTSTTSDTALADCNLGGGTVSTTTGFAIELTVTRLATSTATITFKTGATSTAFFGGGATTTPVVTGELIAVEGVNVSGVISLQSVSSTSSFAAIGPTVTIRSVADPSSSSSVAVLSDGSFSFSSIAPGTYDLIAAAPGFAPMQLNNLIVGLSDVNVVSGILRTGLVNTDEFVNLTDILLTINAFGSSGVTRPDGNGDFTDTNADTFVNLTDILLTIANFGLAGTQPWP